MYMYIILQVNLGILYEESWCYVGFEGNRV